jgi:LCP family protein required for cell wall assembly
VTDLLQRKRISACQALIYTWLVASLILTACSFAPQAASRSSATPSPQPSETPSPTSDQAVDTGATPAPTFDPKLPNWQNYPAPKLTPVTPVPRPLTGLKIPEDVQVALLLGNDRNAPFVGRTDTIMLIFYNTRLARASLLSVPPDLFVYIPGYTMQRLQVAYAVGGIRQMQSSMAYNLGVTPQRWALINLDDFARLVDNLGGLDVTVLHNDPDHCGGLQAGVRHMGGEQTLCYVRLREGPDEGSRNQRQQEILGLIFQRLLDGEMLLRLPDIYDDFHTTVQTNVSVADLTGSIPLALKLGDLQRVGFYYFGQDELSRWQIPGKVNSPVFLPNRGEVKKLVQQAINFVLTPEPLSDVVITLEAQATQAAQPADTQAPEATQPESTPEPPATATKIPQN